MALDGVFLSRVKNELSEALLGSRIDKIYQPSKEEIVLSFRTYSKAFKLLVNINAASARVHLTNEHIENPKTPPMFCMLLRKHLSSGKLIGIRQDGFERIIYFDIDSANEMGDICSFTLAAEIMGRHSNLILIDSNEKIIDSLKRVGHDMSSVRTVLPGMPYTAPAREDRLSLTDFSRDELLKRLSENDKLSLSKALIRIYEGISPVFAREAEFYAVRGAQKPFMDMSPDEADRLIFFLNQKADELLNGTNKYTLIKSRDGQLKDFCFCSVNQYGALMITEEFSRACVLLDGFYSGRDKIARLKQRANDLFRLLTGTSERIARRIANQREDLKACQNREELRIKGDLIMANIYRLSKGDGSFEAEDYTKEGSPSVRITLDRRLTPAQNAQKYYNDYKKADTAEKKLKKLISDGESELLYIDSVFDSLTRAESADDISLLRAELAEQGYIRQSKIKGRLPKAQPPLKFMSSDGYEILVGRNNKQNDRLTLKESEKTDIWLHTQKITGSHTVIRCRGELPPDRTIEEAALIAAYHSSARESSAVPVDYTLIRYVKKPSGAAPGMVIFTNYKTVYVTPEKEFIERLRLSK